MQRASQRIVAAIAAVGLAATVAVYAAPAGQNAATPETRNSKPVVSKPVANKAGAGRLGGSPIRQANVPATTNATTAATQPSSRQVMDQLLKQRSSSPPIKANKKPVIEYVPNRVGLPAAADKVNPAVLGVAPGEKQPRLLREGTFIISRRGRLIRSEDGSRELFEFEADSAQSPEAPMILEPCRKLESMEKVVQQRGDSVVFIVSGQVHTYHGANYLMPTMMKIAPERGNLGR